MQLLNLRVPRDASPQLYQQLIDCSDSSANIILRKNYKLINNFDKHSKLYPEMEGPGVIKCINIQNHTNSIIAFIDSLSLSISATNRNKSSYINNNIINKIQDTVSEFIDSTINIINQNIREGFYADVIENIWQMRNSPDWLHKLLTYQSKEEAIAILSVIKLNIIATTYNTINHLIIEHEYSCCMCFTPIQTISIPLQKHVFKGDNIRAILMLVFPYNNQWNRLISYKPNSGRITKVENGVATLIATAPSAGVHALSGTGSIEQGDSTHTVLWQTQYYVAPKGIYMHIDNANKCYAGIPFNMSIGLEEYSADKLSLRRKMLLSKN